MGKITKNKDGKLITARQMYRMVAQSQDLPMEVVQDVITCFEEALLLAISEGYTVNMPKTGYYRPVKKKGAKKGEVKRTSKMIYENLKKSEDYEKKFVLYEKDGEYFKEMLEDEADYYLPRHKFVKSYKDRVKERSIEKWQQ